MRDHRVFLPGLYRYQILNWLRYVNPQKVLVIPSESFKNREMAFTEVLSFLFDTDEFTFTEKQKLIVMEDAKPSSVKPVMDEACSSFLDSFFTRHNTGLYELLQSSGFRLFDMDDPTWMP